LNRLRWRSRAQRPLARFSVLRLAALLAVYGWCGGAGAAYYMYSSFDKELPDDLAAALDYHPSRATLVYSADGELIGEFFLQKRKVVPLDRIPTHVSQAFISAEDRRFWHHPGFDVFGIIRAAHANFVGGGVRQGASTITQQVTRMLMLSQERTLSRKAKELILSVRVERELSKTDILHIYLNHVYLGHGAYGVQAAAEIYFGKDVDHLTVAEAAMLAGLPQAPTRYSPHVHWQEARDRQRYVIDRLVDDKFITADQGTAAWSEPIAMVSAERPLNAVAAPYFVEHIRRWATDRYGHNSVFFGGLRIYTTLDTRQQLAAEAALREGLEQLDRELGFRGPIGHLDDAELTAFAEGPQRPLVHGVEGIAIGGNRELLRDVVYVGAVTAVRRTGRGAPGVAIDTGPRELDLDERSAQAVLRWKGERGERLEVGDLLPVELAAPAANARAGSAAAATAATATTATPADVAAFSLAQTPDVQGALVSIDPATERVETMVGGYDYARSQFNRVTQARRQAGSAIKPFIYAAALARHFSHLSVVADAPVAVRTATGIWTPENFTLDYQGPVTLRTALAKSLNTVSVRLVLAIGVDAVVEMIRSLGVTSPFTRHISIALGTPDLTLLEMTAAYAAFPGGGKRIRPRFVDLVTTDDGVILEDHRNEVPAVQAISPELAYLMVDLMKTVVDRGTGKKAQALGRPAGGKTGTSTGHRDAWFIAFTADRIAGVWVGRDDFTPLHDKATGGAAALPIWLSFMRAAHPDTPPREFPPPENVVFVRASELTGAPMPAGSHGSVWVPFARGTVPARFTSAVEASQFRASGAFPALRDEPGPPGDGPGSPMVPPTAGIQTP
jgi:penicillin-binding protein 1A